MEDAVENVAFEENEDFDLYKIAAKNIDNVKVGSLSDQDIGLIKMSSHLPEITAMLTYSATIATMWRQPFMLGEFSQDGGALVYLILYGLCLVVLSFPIVLIENTIGRYVRKGVVETMYEMGGIYFVWCGVFIAILAIGTSGYLSLVISWVAYYMISSYGYEMPSQPIDIVDFFTIMRTEYVYYLVALNIGVTIVAAFFMFKGIWVISVINTFISCPLLILIQLGLAILTIIQKDSTFGVPLLVPNLRHFGTLKLYQLAGSQASFAVSAGYGIYISCGRYIAVSKFNVVKRSVGAIAVVLFFSLVSGPTTMLTVVNGYSKIYEDQDGVVNVTCQHVAKELRNESIGMIFIAAHTLLGPMHKTGRSIAIVYFSCTFLIGIGFLASLREVGVRALQDANITRNRSIVLISVMSGLCAIFHVIYESNLQGMDNMWMIAMVYAHVFLCSTVLIKGFDMFRDKMLNINQNDIYVPESLNIFLYVGAIAPAIILMLTMAFDIYSLYNTGVFNYYTFSPLFLSIALAIINLVFVFFEGNMFFFEISMFKKKSTQENDMQKRPSKASVITNKEADRITSASGRLASSVGLTNKRLVKPSTDVSKSVPYMSPNTESDGDAMLGHAWPGPSNTATWLTVNHRDEAETSPTEESDKATAREEDDYSPYNMFGNAAIRDDLHLQASAGYVEEKGNRGKRGNRNSVAKRTNNRKDKKSAESHSQLTSQVNSKPTTLSNTVEVDPFGFYSVMNRIAEIIPGDNNDSEIPSNIPSNVKKKKENKKKKPK